MALGSTGNAVIELLLFHASSVSAYASLLQWQVLSVYILLIPMVWFVYVQLGTARRWLAGTISLIWTIALASPVPENLAGRLEIAPKSYSGVAYTWPQ